MEVGTWVIRIALSAVLVSLSPNWASAQPVVNAVTNGASFEAWISPGSLISIWGLELSPGTVAAATVPLPTRLEDVSVAVGDLEAPLHFVSPHQINAQLPFETPLGDVTLSVTNSAGTSNLYTLRVTDETLSNHYCPAINRIESTG